MNERQISKSMQGKEKIFWLYFNSNQCKISYDRENNSRRKFWNSWRSMMYRGKLILYMWIVYTLYCIVIPMHALPFNCVLAAEAWNFFENLANLFERFSIIWVIASNFKMNNFCTVCDVNQLQDAIDFRITVFDSFQLESNPSKFKLKNPQSFFLPSHNPKSR